MEHTTNDYSHRKMQARLLDDESRCFISKVSCYKKKQQILYLLLLLIEHSFRR